jgi:hypothetical protein
MGLRNNTNPRGFIIENFIFHNNLTYINTGTPTHFKTNAAPSAIDLTISSTNISSKINWYVYNNNLGSDHQPIIISYNENPQYEDTFSPRWKFNKADWQSFSDRCLTNLTPSTFTITDSTENDITTFQNRLTENANATIPKTKQPRKNRRPLPNDAIKTAIYNRNRASNKMKRHLTMENIINYKKISQSSQKNHIH